MSLSVCGCSNCFLEQSLVAEGWYYTTTEGDWFAEFPKLEDTYGVGTEDTTFEDYLLNVSCCLFSGQLSQGALFFFGQGDLDLEFLNGEDSLQLLEKVFILPKPYVYVCCYA